VEAIASQSPKDLTRWIEHISGSIQLKAEYERLKEIQDRASDQSAFNFNKKKTMNAEVRQFKEQKEEADRFMKLIEEKEELIVLHLLWKCYHIEDTVQQLLTEIEKDKESVEALSEEQMTIDDGLKEAKKVHAKINGILLKLEDSVSLKQKELENLVRILWN
jgi:structural maintenance of chromosome 1